MTLPILKKPRSLLLYKQDYEKQRQRHSRAVMWGRRWCPFPAESFLSFFLLF
jgi:hypothetical protein